MGQAGATSLYLRLQLCALVLGCAWSLGGCSVADLATADRYAQGLIVVLPGIEGRSMYNVSIARGLDEGRVGAAIEIFDWGTSAPGGFLVNLTAIDRNQRQADRLVERILSYQKTFPGRPVHLIGHSGGAGIVLMTLQSLPQGKQVSGAILLAAAVAPNHDLTNALGHTASGVWNFHSRRDLSFLGVGTSVFGTMDRKHTSAAGAIGFSRPEGLSPEGKRLYSAKLHESPHTKEMARVGCDGSHFGWANQHFVRKWLAPLIRSNQKEDSQPWCVISQSQAQTSPKTIGSSD